MLGYSIIYQRVNTIRNFKKLFKLEISVTLERGVRPPVHWLLHINLLRSNQGTIYMDPSHNRLWHSLAVD